MSDATQTRKRAAAAATAAAAAFGSAAATISPASAEARSPSESCPGNTLCMWAEFNFNYPNGPVNWFYPGLNPYEGPHHTSYQFYTYSSDNSRSLNDSVSSVWNNSNRWVKMCWAAHCDGAHEPKGICIAPGGAAPDLSVADYLYGNPPQRINNAISAHYTYGSRPDPGTHCYTIITRQGCSI